MSFSPANSVVWVEMPVRDLDKAVAFYSSVMGYDMVAEEHAPYPMVNFPGGEKGVAGHLYVGTPAKAGAGPTTHFAIPDTVEEAAARCFEAGGSVIGDIVTIPPGRFQCAQDPDGNAIGLFEPAKG